MRERRQILSVITRGRRPMTGVVLAGGMVAALMAQPQAALAACQGVNTANVLCDAANQATGGTLMTTFPGTTTVDVNAGGRINTGGAAATVTAPGSLTFNNNDTTFGIVNTGGTGVTLTNNFGAITYTGIGAVTGSGTGNGILATSSGLGAITVTTGGTITGERALQATQCALIPPTARTRAISRCTPTPR